MENFETENAVKNYKSKDVRSNAALLASTAKAAIDDAKTRVSDTAAQVQEESYEQLEKVGAYLK